MIIALGSYKQEAHEPWCFAGTTFVSTFGPLNSIKVLYDLENEVKVRVEEGSSWTPHKILTKGLQVWKLPEIKASVLCINYLCIS